MIISLVPISYAPTTLHFNKGFTPIRVLTKGLGSADRVCQEKTLMEVELLPLGFTPAQRVVFYEHHPPDTPSLGIGYTSSTEHQRRGIAMTTMISIIYTYTKFVQGLPVSDAE